MKPLGWLCVPLPFAQVETRGVEQLWPGCEEQTGFWSCRGRSCRPAGRRTAFVIRQRLRKSEIHIFPIIDSRSETGFSTEGLWVIYQSTGLGRSIVDWSGPYGKYFQLFLVEWIISRTINGECFYFLFLNIYLRFRSIISRNTILLTNGIPGLHSQAFPCDSSTFSS